MACLGSISLEFLMFSAILWTRTASPNNNGNRSNVSEPLGRQSSPLLFSTRLYSFEVREDTRPGTMVGRLEAVHKGRSSLVYSVLEDDGDGLFLLNPNSGDFLLSRTLDFEAERFYVLTAAVQLRDQQLSRVRVYFNVKDVNDNPPVFRLETHSISLPEDSADGLCFLNLRLSDADEGMNGEVDVAVLSGDPEGRFSVNPQGRLCLNGELDRERIPTFSLLIEASDRALPEHARLSSTARVSVHVDDVNDNAPVFVSEQTVGCLEDLALQSVLTVVRAVDVDCGSNSDVTFSLQSSSGDSFRISPTGVVYLQKLLDRELEDEIMITIRARDQGSPELASWMNLTVLVEDVNDNEPKFSQTSYDVVLREDAPPGTNLLTVLADDPDAGLNGEVRYQISESGFMVDPVLGVVTLMAQLDRERRSFHSISIGAADKGDPPRSSTSTVNVTLLDVNDCVPVFSPERLMLHISENKEPSQSAHQVTASDQDDGPNGLLSYYLENQVAQGKFKLHPNGTFRILQRLDREEQSHHMLRIMAVDAGSPPLTGTGTILVLVDDVNDNRPVFDEAELRVQFILEDAPVGTTFGKISASDRDAGANAQISYFLDGPAVPFSINTTSGELFSTDRLDREVMASYVVTVVARDGNPSRPLSSSVTVQVKVRDVNDHTPQFLYGPYVANVPAQLANGSLVCALTATDPDEGKNGRLKFSLHGEHAHLFTVNSDTGTVFIAAALVGTRDVMIGGRVQDGGDAPRMDVTTLTVRFHNASDFPRLAVHVYNDSLYEDTPPGTTVALATSQTYRVGPVSFYLASGDAAEVFELSERTGEMKVRTALDFETNAAFCLTVEARDAGSPPFSTFSQIDVKIVDVNDNPPVFTQSEYRCVVLENVPESYVCDVLATDADSQEYGQVLYEIVSGNHKGAFTMDGTHGSLKATRSLDREDVPEHQLIIKALDKNDGSLTSTALVSVLVMDTNDHAPRFSEIFLAEVPENSPVGSQVILITAVDEDVGVNAVISYSILDHSEQIPFSIDKYSGAITVAGRLDRERQDRYIVRVSANDSDWTVSTDVTIAITDVNDNAPVFSQPLYSVTVPVTQDGRIFLLKVTATDQDLAQNGQILYLTVPPSETFFVNASTGEVSANQPIVPHESGAQILLKRISVTAVDCGAVPLNSSAVVEIALVRYNYFPPSFLSFERFLALPFTLPLGTEVLRVEAVDPDLPYANSSIEYDISGGNASAYFQIDLYFGTVLLSRLLDQNLTLMFEVTATDKGVPPQSSRTDIKVEVTLENAFAPQFGTNRHAFSVPENLPVGSIIGKVEATDQDHGANGLVSYSFKAGNENLFRVGLHSGLIELVKPLDFEKATFHHLLILAKDGAWFPKTGTMDVTINVTDVNDNPPVFTCKQYTAAIVENSQIGSTVIQIEAADEDFGSNAQTIYSLISGRSDLFLLDASNGTISTLAMFDYEQQQHSFELTIKASDADSPNLYDVARVAVQVTDMNEYTPTFQAHVYNFSVPENVPVRTAIGQVLAIDHDLGPSGRVRYLLFGPGKKAGFVVDERSGEIYTSKDLKNRDQNHAALRILAKNEGSIAGFDVDEALVHVHIIDKNDAPEFESGLYTAQVREDTPVGTSITKVRASDQDVVMEWGRFLYGVPSGNVNHSFSIDPVTGIITVANQLDREIWPRYDLTVVAVDEGSPPVTGSTSVIVTVLDVNDNAPRLTTTEAFVRENQPSGTLVATLTVTDDDLLPNQGPFTFWLMRPAPGNSFSLTSDGVLFTSRPLDREANSLFDMSIVIQDAGTPPLSSTTLFHVKVLDENDNPPVPRDINILVKYYGTFFPGGLIGNVRPDDLDELDVFNCSVKGGHNTMFSFPFGMCHLWSSPYHGEATHNMTVEASDNFHPSVNNSIYVNYKGFTNVSLDNCVLFYVSFSNLENFLSMKYLRFAKALDSLFNLQASKSHVFGMKLQGNEMLLLAAMKSYNGLYLSGDVASGITRTHKRLLETQTEVTITQITSDPCSTKPCHNGATCNKNIQVSQEVDVLQSSRLIFVSPQYPDVFNCTCPAGFTGTTCELDVDECLESPCENGGSCYNNPGGFLCRCSDGFSGLHCEVADNECQKVVCSNGGTCWNIQGGFFCDCRPGYEGRFCDDIIDNCASSPCLHGRCSNSLTGYTCRCPFGVTGVNCEEHSYGFEELSYMEFPSLDPRFNFISLEVATVKQNSLLLYNAGEPSTTTSSAVTSTSEFLTLEIVDGKLRLSYDLGSGVIRLETAKPVADGSFHNVTVRRIGNIASLEVDNCTADEPKGFCLARHEGIGTQRTLDVRSNNLTFGGVKSMDVILRRPSQVATHDFVGCVRNVKVNDVLLDASKALDARKILDRCPRADVAPCSGAPCHNGGVCQDHWSYHFCQCSEGFSGASCAHKEHPLFLSEGTHVEFVLKESYVRNQQLQAVLEERDGGFEGIMSLEIKMRTVQQESVFMFGRSETMKLKVKMHDGKPLYVFTHLVFGQHWELSTDTRVSDGQWHVLRLSRHGPSIVLLLDGQLVRNITSSIIKLSSFTAQTIILGSGEFGDGDFAGCVEYIRLNGHLLPFSGHSEMVEAKPSPSLFQTDCGSSDPCPLAACFEESCLQLSCPPDDGCISASPENSWCICSPNGSESEACPQTGKSPPLWIIAAVFPVFLIPLVLILCLVLRRQGKFGLVRHTSQASPPKGHGTDNVGFSLDHADGGLQDIFCKNSKRPDLIVAGEQSVRRFGSRYLTGFEGSEMENDSDVRQLNRDSHGVNAEPCWKATIPQTGITQASNLNPTVEHLSKMKLISELTRPSSFLSDDEIKRLSIVLGQTRVAGSSLTCSEFGYDKQPSGQDGQPARPSEGRSGEKCTLPVPSVFREVQTPSPGPSPGTIQQWESLLNLGVHFSSYSDVFEDISKLPDDQTRDCDIYSDEEQII